MEVLLFLQTYIEWTKQISIIHLKQNAMNYKIPELEIMLLHNSRFVNKMMLSKKEPAANENFTQKEQVTDACWNGYLPKLLPEVFDKEFDKLRKLWEVNETNSFNELAFSDLFPCIDKRLSINPYLFYSEHCCNWRWFYC